MQEEEIFHVEACWSTRDGDLLKCSRINDALYAVTALSNDFCRFLWKIIIIFGLVSVMMTFVFTVATALRSTLNNGVKNNIR